MKIVPAHLGGNEGLRPMDHRCGSSSSEKFSSAAWQNDLDIQLPAI
jgi:hypothetical protein